MLASTVLITALATLATAIPTSIHNSPRAGGPAAVPIPSSCSVAHPFPTLSTEKSYLPKAETNNALFYAAYYDLNTDKEALSKQCLEQCYGYGSRDPIQCKTAFWAKSVPVPNSYYNSPPGTYNTGCLMFNRTLTIADFEETSGHGTTPFAATLDCHQ